LNQNTKITNETMRSTLILTIVVSAIVSVYSYSLGSTVHNKGLATFSTTGLYKNRNHRSFSKILRATSLSTTEASSKVLGSTTDREPCQRSIIQGKFCWQHKWQEGEESTLLATEEEIQGSSFIYNESAKKKNLLRNTVFTLSLAFWISMKRELIFNSLFLLDQSFHPDQIIYHLRFIGERMFHSFVKSLASASTKIIGGSVLASPLVFSIFFGQYLYRRNPKTTELLQTVDQSIKQVKYVCASTAGLGYTPKGKVFNTESRIQSYRSQSSLNSLLKRKTQSKYLTSSLLHATPLHGGFGDSSPTSKENQKKIIRGAGVALSLVLLGSFNKHALIDLFQTLKAKYGPLHFQKTIVPILDGLNNAGIKGQITYTFCLLLWTMTAGITTPVETAAGIVFGVRKGIICNAIGKIGGAVLSFNIGRYLLYKYVHHQLKENELLELVEESIEERPLRVSLMVRFSPLPEFAKNFGLSILNLKGRWFSTAVLLHGLPFTCLWTCLGAETANVMRGGIPSTTLKLLMTGVSWFGKCIDCYDIHISSASPTISFSSY
jgi:uncharacterized membrane protein YdjX (TVP38/TMEM64 family)